jgi:uncharacterized protein
MFHTIVTITYTVPAIYLFIRIWQLFIEKRYRVQYLVVFSILISIYPLSNLLEDSYAGISNVFETVSGYLLPFFLYVFLSVLVLDIVLLINLVFKFVSRETLGKRQFRKRMFLFIIVFSVLVVVAGVTNFNTIRTTEYNITVPRRSSDINNLRIAFVADFHLEEKTPVRFVEQFVRKITSINPDLLLYGGDITEGGRMGPHMVKFEGILKKVNPRYGVYGVLGNHDGYGRGNVEEFLKYSGIRLLKDSVAVLGNSFAIAGRHDSRVRDRLSAEMMVSNAPPDLPLIMVDHRPTELVQISKTGVDISLSGHVHNGQLFPINFIMKRLYELSYGHLKKGNTHFFVTSGIRLWGPPVRTAGKSEVLVVNVSLE